MAKCLLAIFDRLLSSLVFQSQLKAKFRFLMYFLCLCYFRGFSNDFLHFLNFLNLSFFSFFEFLLFFSFFHFMKKILTFYSRMFNSEIVLNLSFF